MRATVKDFVNHIDYAVKKIGIDHVGISSDFDGGGGVDGWNDASETFNVTLELVRRGYTEEQIGKIWSGNLLRVMDEVQKVAAGLQKAQNSEPGDQPEKHNDSGDQESPEHAGGQDRRFFFGSRFGRRRDNGRRLIHHLRAKQGEVIYRAPRRRRFPIDQPQ